MGRQKRKKQPLFKKILISIALFVIIFSLAGVYKFYQTLFQPNVYTQQQDKVDIFIPTGSTFEDVKQILSTSGTVINTNTFEWVSELRKYKNNVKPGKYTVMAKMGNFKLVNLLRLGAQTPVKLVFNNVRYKEALAERISAQIEASADQLLSLLNNEDSLFCYGLNPDNVMVLFLPNTYEFFWNTTAREFMDRMYREYKKFWTNERLNKAKEIGLNPAEVSILASIVQMETRRTDEMSTIAGVYLNRLRLGRALEADPTVVYALGDFSVRRVLKIHTKYDSPYNTYKYTGLPPGPICMPNIVTINKVLNASKHDYLYFCARDDSSGYHSFSKTYAQHLQLARRYHRTLSSKNIR